MTIQFLEDAKKSLTETILYCNTLCGDLFIDCVNCPLYHNGLDTCSLYKIEDAIKEINDEINKRRCANKERKENGCFTTKE